MKILLHICCGPCSIYPVQQLRETGMDIYGYFYNPNIHPYTEFERRKETLEKYAADIGLNVIFDNNYQLEEFLQGIVHRESKRCQFCYSMRLSQAARVARKGEFDYFSTTLLVSPYQKHDLIRETGEAIGDRYGVPFYYADFRNGYREAVGLSKKLGMYRQQYCGCIYSEKERYCRGAKTSGGKKANLGI
ncbi:epoxyqueuosine reductase QueH [Pelotomaculum isophthalicicum JI]|uniref:Epoxyqueuosine reductase QueH n=1 Tax=Pelotomaculum isophthalicicum JI TaxID=947010 RepID=A0A9X4GZF3_9FIRM|nr:epoxyqueuosine reductase QueH [Pelotomaculum isophthalicicum]MDF9408690.1 epoxyqueuosine reductase QueH [Pelotomaculum isophthalicicum JI]